MAKKKRILNPKEAAIIKILHEYGGWVTANEISELTNIAYVTVRKYLKKLEKEGIILKENHG